MAFMLPPVNTVGHRGALVGVGFGVGLGVGLGTAPKTLKYFVTFLTFPAASVDTIRSEWSPLWLTLRTGLNKLSLE